MIRFTHGAETPKAIGIRFTGDDGVAKWALFISYWRGNAGIEWPR